MRGLPVLFRSLPRLVQSQLEKVFIANRGEIACRIVSTLKALRISSVGLYSEEDAGCRHVKELDKALKLRGPPDFLPKALAPYLDPQGLVQAAKAEACDAIHPGYGFLSENTLLSQLCQDNAIKFIGPRPEILEIFGNKLKARRLALKYEIPILKGCESVENYEEALKEIQTQGMSYPLIVKAVVGGGGRGMRVVRGQDELKSAIERCKSEAKMCFNNDRVFMEEYIENARHIEVQIASDSTGDVRHLYERDCSVQKGNQKVVEFAPSRLSPELASNIRNSAVRLIENCGGFQGVCTVEFMVYDNDRKYIMMEVNPRIQVEHTITEEITGIDIVKTQILLASGVLVKDIPGLQKQADIQVRGSSMQLRVSLIPPTQATSPENKKGELTSYKEPPSTNSILSGSGFKTPVVRVDSLGYLGLKPSFHFDPLLAKLIFREDEFEGTRQLAIKGLRDFEISGVEINRQELDQILAHPTFVSGSNLYTSFLSNMTSEQAKSSASKSAGPQQIVEIRAPMESLVVDIFKKVGDTVEKGAPLAIVSAMKLETNISAEASGVIKEIHCKAGDQVSSDDIMFVLATDGGSAPASEISEAETVSSQNDRGIWEDLKEDNASHPLVNEFYTRVNATLEAENFQKFRDQHAKRNKFLPRERIARVCDPGTHFLELSLLSHGKDDTHTELPSGGIVTGIGIVHGKHFVFVANDPTIKGGTYAPITVKKHLRAQKIAEQNGLPCIYLVDSGGALLPKQDEVFPDVHHFGRIFFNQARMSSQGIPQVSCVLGSCTAGGAYVPAMSDESVIIQGNGSIFLAGPPLVKAATGEDVDIETLGGAKLHTQKSGLCDHYCANELTGLAKVRDICKNLAEPLPNYPSFEKSLERNTRMYDLIPASNNKPFPTRKIIEEISDPKEFSEFKENYGKTIICGFTKVAGMKVGVIANNGVLFSESALKATHFIQLCNQREVPLLFLQNITGFMVGSKYEAEGIAKHGAKLVTAVSCATVPKITIVVGASNGAGTYGMCGRAYDPNFMFIWPNATISVMGGQQAAEVLTVVKQEQLKKRREPAMDSLEIESFQAPILEKYKIESSAFYSSARLWDDGIIDPADTRKVVALCLDTFKSAKPKKQSTYGIFRM